MRVHQRQSASGFTRRFVGHRAAITIQATYDEEANPVLFNVTFRERDPVTRREWPGPSFSLTAAERDWMNTLTHKERTFMEGTFAKRDLDYVQGLYCGWREGRPGN